MSVVNVSMALGPIVDIAGEGVALLGCPYLLVAGLAAVVLGEWRRRACPLGVMGL